jgi:hypothetical protein
MPDLTLSDKEVKLILDMIDNQLDMIYQNINYSATSEFMTKRIELLLNMQKRLSIYEE